MFMQRLTLLLWLLALASAASVRAASNDDVKPYIVLFKEGLIYNQSLQTVHGSWVHSIIKRDGDESAQFHNYWKVGDKVSGYHGDFTENQIEEIRNHKDVAAVEPNSYDKIQSLTYRQHDVPWGLSRISHKESQGTGKNSSLDFDYIFLQPGGRNTTIYILDTGVSKDHVEFKGRLRWGPNFSGGPDVDDNGHGTHVAGISAGTKVGVSKFAEIVAVKILDKDQKGLLSSFVKAVDWVIEDHKANPDSRSVINYSAVGIKSDVRNKAINQALDAGIMFVGAAGNEYADACNYGPPDNSRNKSGQLVVAALNYTDHPAEFSNYGDCVDVYAPGVDIYSSNNEGPNGYESMSGTSMASPFVAGLASYYWSVFPDSSIQDIHDKIVNSNSDAVLDDLSDTANRLAYNNAD
ncbi:alkaline extracellular protease [Trichomonascus vanleenenianus]|uniref:S8 family peptidase n=1 Tax=Trichomonascus vanleenenianus TaxID=2268995 RepID=UPI003ECA32A1